MKTIMKIIYLAIALFAFACFVLSPQAQAVSPPPDGGYPGFNTAEGQDALGSVTTALRTRHLAGGRSLPTPTPTSIPPSGRERSSSNNRATNTAVGAAALLNNVDGSDNNAAGRNALNLNVSGFFNNAHGRSALVNNTESENNAFGDLAMENNMTGRQ
jgi:trimeric autotransporter adhesin